MFPRPEAHRRAAFARAALKSCRLCASECGVDRTAGPAGACDADATSRVFYEGVEWAGEASLVPTYVVSLSGCNMRCAFCITGGPSQDARAGRVLDADAVGARIAARGEALRSVTILGGEPSIHLDGALEIAARVPRDRLLVWKTNAYASPEALDLLGDVPDVILADLKFGDDACAERLAGVSRYSVVVRANLRWAAARKPGRLIVRHLLMPGHLNCCFAPVATWIARELPDVPLSLMTGYLPVFRAAQVPGMGRTNAPGEADAARDIAVRAGLRLERHAMCPPASGGVTKNGRTRDEIWIDRSGRICVDSGSPALIAALGRLAPEIEL